MIATTEGHVMRQTPKRMRGNTVFHRQAEETRQLNEKNLADIKAVYVAQQQLAELAWQKKHSYTARRKKFEADWRELKLIPFDDRAHPPLGIWKRGCERNDIRAYAAKRTQLVDIANIQQALWWYSLTEKQRFAIFLDSMPIIADDAAQERREKTIVNYDAD